MKKNILITVIAIALGFAASGVYAAPTLTISDLTENVSLTDAGNTLWVGGSIVGTGPNAYEYLTYN